MTMLSLVDSLLADNLAERAKLEELRALVVAGQQPPESWSWPTEFRFITQEWGARPEYYAQFGLPGHDGKDIRATVGSKIFAVRSARVFRIDTAHPAYGYSIRLQYQQDGVTWEVIYAHGVAGSSLVRVGDLVVGGQQIMKADTTGNAQGSHLHLGLKKLGFTYKDKYPDGRDRVWPFNLYDPTAFLGSP